MAEQISAYTALGAYLYSVVRQYIQHRGGALVGLSMVSEVERDELAHDFVQQALVQIHEKLAEYRGEGAFLNWATTIAVRKAGEELRKAHWQTLRYDPTLPLPAEHNSQQFASSLNDIGRPDVQISTAEMWDVIIEAVQNDLSEQQRRAFLARFVEDRSNHEIAATEGVTASVIYQRIHQARLKIRRRLDAAGYGLQI